MSVSGIAAAANFQPAPTQQVSQTPGHHKHRGQHPSSISDVDAQSSSLASSGGSTGKTGSLLDVTA
jgi:hypothetical protein